MGKVYEGIDPKLAAWLMAQPMFVVATAPLDEDGLINVSPKGMAGTFAVLDEQTVAYLDLTGSGIETIAHLRQNGRIVVMFTAFDGRPNIVRLHGRGEVVLPDDPRFRELRPRFSDHPGVRSIIVVTVARVSDSCGYAVPAVAVRPRPRRTRPLECQEGRRRSGDLPEAEELAQPRRSTRAALSSRRYLRPAAAAAVGTSPRSAQPNRRTMAPATMNTVAPIRYLSAFSFRMKIPTTAANRIDVSRNAATAATGALVIAHRTSP